MVLVTVEMNEAAPLPISQYQTITRRTHMITGGKPLQAKLSAPASSQNHRPGRNTNRFSGIPVKQDSAGHPAFAVINQFHRHMFFQYVSAGQAHRVF